MADVVVEVLPFLEDIFQFDYLLYKFVSVFTIDGLKQPHQRVSLVWVHITQLQARLIHRCVVPLVACDVVKIGISRF